MLSVALVLCFLSLGAICYPMTNACDPACISCPCKSDVLENFTSLSTMQNVSSNVGAQMREKSSAAVQLYATHTGGRDMMQNFTSPPKQNVALAFPGAAAAAAAKQPVAQEVLDVKGALGGGDDKIGSDDDVKAALEAMKEAKGIKGAAWCVVAFFSDLEPSKACATASPTPVAAVTVVLSLYLLFGFAPFYLFPEAAAALLAWGAFPLMEKKMKISPTDNHALVTMRMSLLATSLIAVFPRLFKLLKERNEQCAAGRQRSMIISLLVVAVLYMIITASSPSVVSPAAAAAATGDHHHDQESGTSTTTTTHFW